MNNIDKLYAAGIRDGITYISDMVEYLQLSVKAEKLNMIPASGYSLGCAFVLMLWAYDVGVEAKAIKRLAKLAIE